MLGFKSLGRRTGGGHMGVLPNKPYFQKMGWDREGRDRKDHDDFLLSQGPYNTYDDYVKDYQYRELKICGTDDAFMESEVKKDINDYRKRRLNYGYDGTYGNLPNDPINSEFFYGDLIEDTHDPENLVSFTDIHNFNKKIIRDNLSAQFQDSSGFGLNGEKDFAGQWPNSQISEDLKQVRNRAKRDNKFFAVSKIEPIRKYRDWKMTDRAVLPTFSGNQFGISEMNVNKQNHVRTEERINNMKSEPTQRCFRNESLRGTKFFKDPLRAEKNQIVTNEFEKEKIRNIRSINQNAFKQGYDNNQLVDFHNQDGIKTQIRKPGKAGFLNSIKNFIMEKITSDDRIVENLSRALPSNTTGKNKNIIIKFLEDLTKEKVPAKTCLRKNLRLPTSIEGLKELPYPTKPVIHQIPLPQIKRPTNEYTNNEQNTPELNVVVGCQTKNKLADFAFSRRFNDKFDSDDLAELTPS